MVTSCIAHTAPTAADSGFLWLSVSRWERGTNRQRMRQREKMATAGLLPVVSSLCRSPNPLQVQPSSPKKTVLGVNIFPVKMLKKKKVRCRSKLFQISNIGVGYNLELHQFIGKAD